jgi:electron transfer flavoprotein alpha subunit
MCGDVCVVVEILRGEICEITYTMLAAGRRLARAIGAKLSALVIGNDLQKLLESLGAADRAVCIEHPELADFNPEAYLRAAASIFAQHRPRVILFGHTSMGTDLACGLAGRLKLPLVTCCRSFSTDGGPPRYVSLICGGKLTATGPLPEPCCLVTLMTGGYRAEEGKVASRPAVESWPAPDLSNLRTRLRRYNPPPAGDVDIAKQPILVSVGRGIQNKDNISLAEELAKALGGTVSGSRPVIDQEWLPSTRLVGKSGKQVKPKLYLALGISGAPEHAEGMRDSELIVAINRDEKAPIYGFAHYGAAVDVLELIPVLTQKVQQARGG